MSRRLRLGVAGLGRAFTLMLPTLRSHPRIQLVAAADPRAEARERFAAEFGARTYESAEALCDDAGAEAIYIATPHEMHAGQIIAAAARGRHVLVEKPIAIGLDEAREAVDAARRAGVRVVVGHSHSFDAPIARAREIVESGEVGSVRMIHAMNFTDFLYRPRRPEELSTAKGGGVFFSQAAHQVDIVRLLAGGRVRSVRAFSGAWDPARPTEGAYAALLGFDNGVFASLTYSGYGRFDSDELCGGVSELGGEKSAQRYAGTKEARNYGGAEFVERAPPKAHEHFGFLVVSCERGDLRPLPNGVMVHGDAQRMDAIAPPRIPRREVIDELCGAVLDGRAPLHDGEWGIATLAACLAMLESAREGREVTLAP